MVGGRRLTAPSWRCCKRVMTGVPFLPAVFSVIRSPQVELAWLEHREAESEKEDL